MKRSIAHITASSLAIATLAILAPSLLAGCGSSWAGPSFTPSVLETLDLPSAMADPYPLDLGRTWVYHSLDQNDGQAPQVAPDQKFWVAQQVSSGVVIRRSYGSWEAPATLARKTAESVVLSRYVDSGPPATDSITILRFPLMVGAAWPGRQLVGATERIEVAGFESVDVPAGRFEAWHVQHHLTYAAGGGDTLDYWYAPGVGMVEAIERATMLSGGQAHHYQVTASLATCSVTPS